MDTYSFLRELADSWVLLILTLIFLGVIFWAFRPGSRPLHDDAAAVPFRHDDRPAPGCANACPDCRCGASDFLKGADHG
ncbi:cbb3-type cytochrome c oxidase subunit 3 [Palleronia pontilimi]|uniref:cbb3-type cytochrome c oxidase subunit 3 n=1 Tax=Palleronia pontilimi TaxID=1964209 RepID=UPI001F2B0772|nr:cbb3-type cytochrome c oxidase subunit 3 [Palleronia pontilimi]